MCDLTWRMILLGAVACGCGCPRDPDGPQSESRSHIDGHDRMLARLDQIRERTPNDHKYLGDAELRREQHSLTLLGPEGDSRERMMSLAAIGVHQLRLGENEEAIENLTSARRLLDDVRPEVTDIIADSIMMALGVAYLRLGETENCIHCQTGESCILPIRPGGVHEHQRGSRNAIQHFEELLKQNPDHLGARWLLNVAYMTIGEFPSGVPEEFLIAPEAFESDEEVPRFTNIASDLGLDTFGLSGGVAVDDFNGDDLLDIVVSDWSTSGQIRYFRNDGDGSFSDLTERAGLKGLYGGLNLVHVDFDNDGDVDVLVLRGAWLGSMGRHPNSLLRNDGRGNFRDVTFECGLGELHFPTQTAAWSDYDQDGDLDLFVGNESFPCQLFQNDGQGNFVDGARQAGVQNLGVTKGVAWGDFDGDDDPDLYVSNLGQPNRLYRNEGNGVFVDVAELLHVERPIRSFPTWFWDYDNDGHLDLYVASYEAAAVQVAADYLGLPHSDESDRFYRNSSSGRFQDATSALGFTRVTMPMGCSFGDIDNDGFLDFYLGTGDPMFENLVPNLMFRNRDGAAFSDVTQSSALGHLQKGHGVAFADFDNDGDQDLFIVLGGAYLGDGFQNAFFENPGSEHHWLKVKLIGATSNRSAIGARLRIEVKSDGKTRSIYRWIDNGSSFGGNPLRQEIGLGDTETVERLEVYWPMTGQTQIFEDVSVDQYIEIVEGASEYVVRPLKRFEFSTRPAK